jgi:ABC-type nitrate/sulfonate/bicarbonate transport system substrate-binding protein
MKNELKPSSSSSQPDYSDRLLVPLKDVQILSIGAEKVILDALVAGRIHGATLSPPWPFEAEKHGFKIMLKASDVVQFHFAGICTYLDKIKNNREQIKKVISR